MTECRKATSWRSSFPWCFRIRVLYHVRLRRGRVQYRSHFSTSGSLAMLATMLRASSRVSSLAPDWHVSECMRRSVKQFELSFQHRDTNIRLGAPENSA